MKAIWTENKPEFHGDFVDFGEMMTWPKPVQKPHPPILVGGGFPHSARRAIDYGDAWMPLGRGADMVAVLPQFRQMAAEAGRDPDSLPVSIFMPLVEAEALSRMRDADVARVVLPLPSAGADEVLPLLDEYAALAEAVG